MEDELLRLGAIFEKVADWQPFSVVDGRLVTGQNPASSTTAAQNLINLLARKAAYATWADKDREEWFSLGENHEKVVGFGLRQLRNRLAVQGIHCASQGASTSPWLRCSKIRILNRR